MEKFTYTSGDWRFVISRKGLEEVYLGPRMIAHGPMHVEFFDTWFGDYPPAHIPFERPGTGSLTSPSKKRATLRHTYPSKTHSTVQYFTFSSPDPTLDTVDLLVEADITNRTDLPINAPGLQELYVQFRENPEGYWMWQHWTYFNRPGGIRDCHPGSWQRIGGTFAEDGTFGLGTSPRTVDSPPPRSLTMLYTINWDPETGQLNEGPKQVIHVVHQPIPPKATGRIAFSLRFSKKRDWKHLLAPYKSFYEQHWVAPYKALAPQPLPVPKEDWILQEHFNQDRLTPESPEGFAPYRRIDTTEGRNELLLRMLEIRRQDPAMQGMLSWSITGTEPSGVYLNPQVNALPEHTEQNWKWLWDQFAWRGILNGIATRPLDEIVKLSLSHNTIVRMSPYEESARALIWHRYKWAIDRLVTLFYVDSMGDTLEDWTWMVWLRKQIQINYPFRAEHIQTFVENPSDVLLPISGVYAEVRPHPHDGSPAFNRWGNLMLDIFRWLSPSTTILARDIKLYWNGVNPLPNHLENFEASCPEFFRSRGLKHLLFSHDFTLNGQKEWRQ